MGATFCSDLRYLGQELACCCSGRPRESSSSCCSGQDHGKRCGSCMRMETPMSKGPCTDEPWYGRRVLVTGATGLLGRQVCRKFEAKGWMIRGLAFSRATGTLVRCDLTEPKELAKQFEDFRPEVVVHCAAERRPDRLEADKSYAQRINENVARDVAQNCGRHGAWLVHLSTNYVFDGTGAPYAEDATPQPLSVYGESKLAGERAIQAATSDCAILRVPLLYGPIERIGETSVDGLLSVIRAALEAENSPKFDNWQERFPTNTEDVADVIEAMAAEYISRRFAEYDDAETDLDALRGIFHWQANQRHTKYTMAVTIAEIAAMDPSNFLKVDTAPAPGCAPRPQFERMLCPRLEKLLGITGQQRLYRSDFKERMKRILAPFL